MPAPTQAAVAFTVHGSCAPAPSLPPSLFRGSSCHVIAGAYFWMPGGRCCHLPPWAPVAVTVAPVDTPYPPAVRTPLPVVPDGRSVHGVTAGFWLLTIRGACQRGPGLPARLGGLFFCPARNRGPVRNTVLLPGRPGSLLACLLVFFLTRACQDRLEKQRPASYAISPDATTIFLMSCLVWALEIAPSFPGRKKIPSCAIILRWYL